MTARSYCLKRKSRTFEIPKLSDEEEEEGTLKKQKMEKIREWSNDDVKEEDVIYCAPIKRCGTGQDFG